MQDELIRKQAVKEQMIKYGFHAPDMTVTEFVEDLPPVNPQPCGDAIDRKLVCAFIDGLISDDGERKKGLEYIRNMPPVTPQPKTGWNNHQIACMLADLFGDACACNYNGIDEWLGELCDFKDTCCPNPVGVACWEQFLKYSQSRYTECGYEVRDKNALQEPKTGTWEEDIDNSRRWDKVRFYCSECGRWQTYGRTDYCPSCGCRMVEPQESERTL